MKTSRNLLYLGFTIFLLVVYNRVFFKRIPHELYNFLSFQLIVIYCSIIITFFLSVVFCIFKLINKNNLKYTTINKYNNYLKKITHYYFLSLKVFDTFIKANISDVWVKLTVKLSTFICNKIQYKNIQYLTWVFDFLPRILIALTFAFDTIYLQQFYYFFKLIPILILPIIYNYILYTIKGVCEINIDDCPKYFRIQQYSDYNLYLDSWEYVKFKLRECVNNPTKVHQLFTNEFLLNDNLSLFQFSFSETYLLTNKDTLKNMSDEDISELLFSSYLGLNQMFVLPFIYVNRIETYQNLQLIKVQLFVSTIFLISWVYILCYGLGVI
jgi:hypothetical protein